MLNKEETRLLAKYHFALTVSKYALLFIFLGILINFVFGSIVAAMMSASDIENKWGSFAAMLSPYLLLVLILALIVLYFYASSVLKKAQDDRLWQEVEAKIDTELVHGGLEDSEHVSLSDLAKARRRSTSKIKRELSSNKFIFNKKLRPLAYKIEYAFDAYHLAKPKRSLLFKLIMIACLLLNVSTYIPALVSNLSFRQAALDRVEETFTKLDAAFLDESYSTFHSELEYDEYGYYYSAYFNYEMDHYISINIDNDGLINHVGYSYDLDVAKDIVTNLDEAQATLDEYHALLLSSNVEAKNERYLARPTISESFRQDFIAMGNYENNLDYTNDNMRVALYTDPEYDYADIYVDIY